MRLLIPGFSRYYLDTEDYKIYNKFGHPMSESISYNRYGKHPVINLALVDDYGVPRNVKKHRAVYKAFYPDIDISDAQINHLDENPLNNDISNLEPCTPKENMNWGTVGKRISEANKGKINNHRSRPIVAYVLDPYEVERYPSMAEAERVLGAEHTAIYNCCNGYRVDYLGRIWQYDTSRM